MLEIVISVLCKYLLFNWIETCGTCYYYTNTSIECQVLNGWKAEPGKILERHDISTAFTTSHYLMNSCLMVFQFKCHFELLISLEAISLPCEPFNGSATRKLSSANPIYIPIVHYVF